MTRLFRHAFALLIALGATVSVSAAEAPVRQVPGEPVRAAKARPIVQFRAPTAAPARLAFDEMDLMRVAELQKRNGRQGVALQIGIHRPVEEAATPMPSLRWMPVPGGQAARLEVASADALGLRVGLHFDRIPTTIELRVSGSLAPSRVKLAPGAAIARQHADTRGTYWTPGTDGDIQTIELFAPAGTPVTGLGARVVGISHLLTNSLERFSLAKAIGDSGSCNVDVVCRNATLGQTYMDATDSVARMTFVDGGGTFTCTGTLLADTVTTSQIPYFYTADHCVGSQTVASTVNTYWGFETATCGVDVAAGNTELDGGADYLFSDEGTNGTDAALLRLRDPAPAGAYFSGWNAAQVATNASVLAIHHPSGDLKKSSLGQKVGQDSQSIVVGWLNGTTEGGSSGSGLFTATGSGGQYELRGGLYGGTASCANDGDINNAQNRDYYSRLDLVIDDIDQWLAPTTTADPGPTRNYTGAWYVPSESGWGLTAFQYDNEAQVLFVLFFIYDANGVAKWYELGGGWSANDVRSGEVLQSNGNQPWSTSFNPALRTFTPVGNATLTFTSDTTANLTLTVNGVTRNVQVQKL